MSKNGPIESELMERFGIGTHQEVVNCLAYIGQVLDGTFAKQEQAIDDLRRRVAELEGRPKVFMGVDMGSPEGSWSATVEKADLPPAPPFSEDESISFRLAQVLALQAADGSNITSRLARIESKLNSILRDVEEDLILHGNPNAPKPGGVMHASSYDSSVKRRRNSP